MKWVIAVLILLCSVGISPRAYCCPGQSHDLTIDGAAKSTKDGHDLIVLYGWTNNCLAVNTNQDNPEPLMKLTDARVDGYEFCTSKIFFGPPVPRYYPNEAAWNAAPRNQKHWAWFPTKPMDDPSARMTVRNYQQPKELRWFGRFFTGYYKLKPGEAEDKAKGSCADMTNYLANKPQHFPDYTPPPYP